MCIFLRNSNLTAEIIDLQVYDTILGGGGEERLTFDVVLSSNTLVPTYQTARGLKFDAWNYQTINLYLKVDILYGVACLF